jgi:multidrug efflux pump subunit AcrB
MWLIRLAMGRPITMMIVVAITILVSALSISRMKVDIFPNLNLPIIYVVQPYGGMDPAQMEAFLVSHYENHFLYITGVDHIESKSIQNVSVMKIVFQSDADMSEAMSQVVAQVQRSRAKMPPGTVSPFILRFDAGNVPVGYLVLSSPTSSVAEIEDLAEERIRPILSTIPGATTPHPFGGNVRTIVITVNPQRLRSYRLSADDVVNAVTSGNLIAPSGIVRAGNLQRIASINSTVAGIDELKDLPLRKGQGATVWLRDVATVEDSMDISTGWALVDGRRTVFMAVSKLADASTVDVVKRVKAALTRMRAQLPDNIQVSFEFDQSVYVTEGVSGVLYESLIGAALTGLMVLLFLQDFRSALIVILTIPLALLSSVAGLWMSGQTINIMTLSGLSLAVGVLVDEATVAIENIHTHLDRGTQLYKGIYTACCEVVTPQLLAMLSVVFVFLPSFLMVGTTQALFVPLSLAVGFAMVSSYVLSNTFVPVLSGWLLRTHKKSEHHGAGKMHGFMAKLRRNYARVLRRLLRFPLLVFGAYALVTVIALALTIPFLKTEIFPTGNPKSFQMRLKAPTGTRIEVTEAITKKALDLISKTVGSKNVDVSICYVGTQPPNFGISNVYIWTSGPQEAILLVALKPHTKVNMRDLKEKLRRKLSIALPEVTFTFEAGDIVTQIMNLGAPTPIQIDIMGRNLSKDSEYANKVLAALKRIPELRDVGIVQPLEYPTVNIQVDRARAGQLGLTTSDVTKALVPAIYSSRFVKQIWWRVPEQGLSYQVQVQYPSQKMESLQDVETVPIQSDDGSVPFVRDVAKVNFGNMIGEYDRYNLQRMISITANIDGEDLGKAARDVRDTLARLKMPPKGVTVALRGQVPTMNSTFASLATGLILAIVAILLMLVGYFQRFRLALIVVSVIPAILAGVAISIQLSGISLNVQSFMGAIMSIGIGVANAILIVSFSESRRLSGEAANLAAKEGAVSRLRPVLMTSIAMIAGMIPMALGIAEGGERTAPLGIAVIGGLVSSMVAVLFVLPIMFALLQKDASRISCAMLPEDENQTLQESRHVQLSKRFENPGAGID